MRRISCLLFALLFLLTGCVESIIREGGVSDFLPAIDPAAGVEQTIPVTLYYRLAGEPLLVPVDQTISVRASGEVAHALITKLLEGPPALQQDLTSAFPEEARLVEAYQDGSIMYVTLSRALIEPSAFGGTREEQELGRRLAIYSVVNSLMAIPGRTFKSVQIRIDLSGSGEGVSVAPSMLGFGEVFPNQQWLAPLEEEASVVATPAGIAALLLGHLKRDELAEAWPLFAESETGGLQKPDYAAMETELKTLGRLDDFQIHSVELISDERMANVTLDLTWTPRGGETRTVRGALIGMPREGELYKVGYQSFLNALEASR